jgi:hypothetical protein
MKNTLKKLFLKESADWRFWLLLGIIAKSGLFLFSIFQHHTPGIEGFWGYTGGDTSEYLSGTENLLKNGTYYPDFRMPGYAVLYLPLLFFFSKATACNLLIIIQMLLSGISVYILALTVKNLFKSNGLFYFVFYLYAISSYVNLFDADLFTESLTVSVLIFSFYFFVKYFDGHETKFLLFSGLLLTWVVFLKTVMIVILGAFCILIIADSIRKKRKLQVTLLFLLPFIVFDSLWIVHNYKLHKSFIPLTSMIPPSWENSYIFPADNFVASWGGNFIWWDTKAEIRWFGMYWGKSKPANPEKNDISLPDNIYTSKFNIDSLETLRRIIILLNTDTAMPDAQQKIYYKFLVNKFNLYTQSVKQEKPMLYYVIAPLKILKTFLIHSGTYNLFGKPSNQLNKVEYLVKIFYSMFYILTLFLGGIGILLLWKSILRFSVMSLIPVIPAYIIIIHPLVIRASEYRYFVPAFPFMLVCAIYTVYYLFYKFIKPIHPEPFI